MASIKNHNISPAKLTEKERELVRGLIHGRERVFERFPLLFTLLGSFGLVATFYGFERVIDEIDFLSENPYILLASGIVTLVLTGTLYSKLK